MLYTKLRGLDCEPRCHRLSGTHRDRAGTGARAAAGRTVVSDLLFSGATVDAIAELQPALAAARAAGAASLEADLMILSPAPLARGTGDAPKQLRDTTARLKTSGYGQLADVALETPAASHRQRPQPEFSPNLQWAAWHKCALGTRRIKGAAGLQGLRRL